jgi:hypothetical protein
MITFTKPLRCDVDSFHMQVDLLGFGPYSILWDDELTFRFDTELTAEQQMQLAAVVAAHDGTLAIAAREEREAKIAEIVLTNMTLVESAREKRLRGEPLTPLELAALVDLLIFPA